MFLKWIRNVLEVDSQRVADARPDQRPGDEQPIGAFSRGVRHRLLPVRGVAAVDDGRCHRVRERHLVTGDRIPAVRNDVPADRHARDPIVDRAPLGWRGRRGRTCDEDDAERENESPHPRPRVATGRSDRQVTSTSACIHGWTKQIIQSLVPAGAVTVRLTNSPFSPLPVTAESPALSTLGGVCWPTPFSRNGNFGGALPLGSAPCAFPRMLQIRRLTTWSPVFGASFFATIVNVCGPFRCLPWHRPS